MYQNKKNLWRFDLNRRHPLKLQIQNHIEQLISNGQLVPGQQLCSCEQLARINSVSKNTVHRAYSDLIEKNALECCWRKGTYVAEPASKDVEEQYALPSPFWFWDPDSKWAGIGDHSNCLMLGSDCPDASMVDVEAFIKVYKRVLSSSALNKLSTHFSDGQIYRSLTRLLEVRKIYVKPSNIAVCNGLLSSLQMVSALLLKQGGGVAMASPADAHGLFAFTSPGASLYFTGSDQEGMLTEQLELFCRNGKIKVVYVRPSAEYPTMSTMSANRRLHLLQLARKYHFVIVEMNEDHEFFYKQPSVALASQKHDGRIIHICPFSRFTSDMYNIAVVVGPVDFIRSLRKVANRSRICRDNNAERVAVQLIADNSLFHLAAEMRASYRERLMQLPFLLDNYLKEYCTYQLPTSGLSVGIQFNDPVDLKPVSADLSQLGYYTGDTCEEGDENYLYTHLRVGFGHLNMKTLEAALKLIREAAQSAVSIQKSVVG